MTEHVVILKQSSVNELHGQIKNNLALYDSDNPDWESVLGADYARKTRVEINGSAATCFASENFRAMKKKDQVLKNEVSRCVSIYETFRNLTPQQATDERVWTYLTHFVFWDYARARWAHPEDKKKKIQSISSHFFLKTARGMVRDNAISRLWWMAHICNRVQTYSLEQALRALLYKEDVRKEIMERATFCRSEPILNALLKRMVESHEGDKKLHDRQTFRQLSKQLNRIGGKIVLDSLPPSQLDTLVGDVVGKITAKKSSRGK